METNKHWIILITIIVVLDVAAIGISSVTGNIASSENVPFTVSEVYEKSLIGDYVYVKGTVSKVLSDHTSEKGFKYQQFMLSDVEQKIKIFCSVKYGRTDVSEGDEILFNGEYKKFYNTYEIYGFCSEIIKF
ncbi:MAG: hypothetical protein KAS32_31680 [Candidatus Peribacteraceae bacterium]|nr:hypothetical protein [Candidatus Peribacteraceae bacterium]